MSARAPGVAAADAADGKPEALYGAMSVNGLAGIIGTSGVKTAVSAQERAG